MFAIYMPLFWVVPECAQHKMLSFLLFGASWKSGFGFFFYLFSGVLQLKWFSSFPEWDAESKYSFEQRDPNVVLPVRPQAWQRRGWKGWEPLLTLSALCCLWENLCICDLLGETAWDQRGFEGCGHHLRWAGSHLGDWSSWRCQYCWPLRVWDWGGFIIEGKSVCLKRMLLGFPWAGLARGHFCTGWLDWGAEQFWSRGVGWFWASSILWLRSALAWAGERKAGGLAEHVSCSPCPVCWGTGQGQWTVETLGKVTWRRNRAMRVWKKDRKEI